MWFFITCCCHSCYLRLLKLKSSGKRVASTVFLTVPAMLQGSFRVKQCYMGLPPPSAPPGVTAMAVCVQGALCRQGEFTTQLTPAGLICSLKETRSTPCLSIIALRYHWYLNLVSLGQKKILSQS